MEINMRDNPDKIEYTNICFIISADIALYDAYRRRHAENNNGQLNPDNI
jgi:hypothetical protein